MLLLPTFRAESLEGKGFAPERFVAESKLVTYLFSNYIRRSNGHIGRTYGNGNGFAPIPGVYKVAFPQESCCGRISSGEEGNWKKGGGGRIDGKGRQEREGIRE